jgi:ferredoxin-like protein FixX
LYNENGKVCGAKVIDTGVDHHGEKLENFQVGSIVEAKLTILAEGTRGSLTKKLINKFDLQKGKNPQIYSLGCKEIWSVPEGTIKPGEVYHTMGYPAMQCNVFGGGFIYGLNDNKVAVGLALGLDYADPTLDLHKAFQMWKTHPAVAKYLKNGKMIEYGAKTMPEGGWYSLPKLYTDNVLIVGDGAGFFGKLKSHLDSNATKRLDDFEGKKTFKEKTANFEFDKVLTFDKATDVYFSGALHDENQVPHLQINDPKSYSIHNIKEFDAPCQYYCPAEVYELHTDKTGHQELRIHFENCLHCKTCDIKEPVEGITWNVPNGGNGPDYKNM